MRIAGAALFLAAMLGSPTLYGASGWTGSNNWGTGIGTEFNDFSIGNGELCAIRDSGDLSATNGETGCSWGNIPIPNFACQGGRFAGGSPCTCQNGVAEAIALGLVDTLSGHSTVYVASTNGNVYQFRYVDRSRAVWRILAPFPSALAATATNGCITPVANFSVRKLVYQPTDGSGSTLTDSLFMLGSDGHVYKFVPAGNGAPAQFVEWGHGTFTTTVVSLSFSAYRGTVMAVQSDGHVYSWYDGWYPGSQPGWYPYSFDTNFVPGGNLMAAGGTFAALANTNLYSVDFNIVQSVGTFPGTFQDLENGYQGSPAVSPGINSGYFGIGNPEQGSVLDIEEGSVVSHGNFAPAAGNWGGPTTFGPDVLWVRMSGVGSTDDGLIFVFHD